MAKRRKVSCSPKLHRHRIAELKRVKKAVAARRHKGKKGASKGQRKRLNFLARAIKSCRI